ncbi:transcription factor 25 [Bicyclus anynana]|uniref:Transcription factor 25 n=1 Tax=Bicyclus anynana TaxID=110368 RepID=A0ABM3M245_BICAN|nr:transcription factor 25 [Bicyclus anynana]XP_052745580.1 transcription factor 25 [Bicyclus anynana]
MSLRQMKKLYKNVAPSIVQIEDSESDEEDSGNSTVCNSFDVLKLSSEPESEAESDHDFSNEENPDLHEEKKDKKAGNKKNKKKSKTVEQENPSEDDIDLAVNEINKEYGEAGVETTESDPRRDVPTRNSLFTINRKHIYAKNEELRFFGPEEDENGRRKKPKETKTVLKNQITSNVGISNVKGIYMTILDSKDGYTYFVYNHTKEYRQRHEMLLNQMHHIQPRFGIELHAESFKNMHVEAMMLSFAQFCLSDSYDQATMVMEHIICHLQYMAHPFFNITNKQHRLEFKYIENIIFHVALLQYSHMLSRKACHRTALELAKVLLNLDPRDPLAVILIIDKFAINAKEYSWLIDAIDSMAEKDVKYMFNIKYSYALAHYHVAMQNKEDLKKADELLKKALLLFPSLPKLLIPAREQRDEAVKRLLAHPMYNELASRSISQPLHELTLLYAACMQPRWREPAAMQWFVRNALELMDQYDAEPLIRAKYEHKTNVRQTLFRLWPAPVARHLCVIKPMANWLVDGAVPEPPFYEFVHVINPVPDSRTVNRYNYDYPPSFLMSG